MKIHGNVTRRNSAQFPDVFSFVYQMTLCHLHLYKTGQNFSPHQRPRSLLVSQQEVCHTDATVSIMTSHFSRLAT